MVQLQMNGQVLAQRYQIEASLGKGLGGQQTYRALDRSTSQPVVLKLLQFGPGFEWEQLKLFQREAQILETLDHPAIPKYLDSFEIDGPDCKGFVLVQTYIEAQSLEEQLTTGRAFSVAEVTQVAEQLLAILSYLHQHSPSIIHRDIKPSNILLRGRSAHHVGEVSLVDFGSVQNLVATQGGTITVVGTYGYMPPEQFGGRAVPASDLYSLGATIIYLLTGMHPADLPQRELRIEFEQHVPKERRLQRWLRGMIEPALDKRFESAEQALEALQSGRALAKDAARGRPAGSRIRLRDRGDRLIIRIPNPSLGKGINLPPVNGWGCGLAVVMWWIWVTWMGVSWGSKLLLWTMSLLLEKWLFIDDKSVSVEYRLLGQLPMHRRQSRRQYVTQVEVVKAHRRQDKWGTRELPAEIIIWAGNHGYRLSKVGGLTTPEVAWLSQEVSDWMGVEITDRQVPLIEPEKKGT